MAWPEPGQDQELGTLGSGQTFLAGLVASCLGGAYGVLITQRRRRTLWTGAVSKVADDSSELAGVALGASQYENLPSEHSHLKGEVRPPCAESSGKCSCCQSESASAPVLIPSPEVGGGAVIET